MKMNFFVLLSLTIFCGGDGHSPYSIQRGPCQPTSCLHGRCTRAYPLNQQPFHYCVCDPAHSGSRCERQLCPIPCQNGGTCKAFGREFRCHCPRGYSGDSCERRDSSICTRNDPCAPRGTCRLLESWEITQDGRNFTCECEGYAGPFCEIPEHDCTGDGMRCKNEGRCVKLEGEMYCRCPVGFTGEYCESSDTLCSAESCANGGSCLELGHGEYECSCRDGFAGPRCESFLEAAKCEAQPFEYSTAVSQRPSPLPTSPSAAFCLNGGRCPFSSTTCECPIGYGGRFCEKSVLKCELNPCMNGGTCHEEEGGHFHCYCTQEYHGVTCELDKDDCEFNECAPGSTCVDHPGYYSCDCPPGRIGELCDQLDPCHAKLCINGSCYGEDGRRYACPCDQGWTGVNCTVDINECAFGERCQAGGVCINLPGGFKCECPEGRAGQHCELKLRSCDAEPDCCEYVCENEGVCGKEGKCVCPTGFLLPNCRDRAACSNTTCLHGGTCVETPEKTSKFVCQCSPGFQGRHCEFLCDGINCIPTRDICLNNPCQNNATCSTTYLNSFSCSCLYGFQGKLCEEKIGECGSSADDQPCKNGAQCMSTTGGGYKCICRAGFGGVNCGERVASCGRNSCQNGGNCRKEGDGFVCDCPGGFSGKHCSVRESRCPSTPCQNGGNCIERGNGFECECLLGFNGTLCEHNIDDCKEGICLNGGTCQDLVNNFHCHCPRGFTGRICDIYVNVDVFNSSDEADRAMCMKNGCSQLAGDAHCDSLCNSFACGFDGGDCSARTKPFSRCDVASYCAHSFTDGKCDQICNREECLFDGFDCLNKEEGGAWKGRCPEAIRKYCIDHYANGVCDEKCHLEQCGMDGGDCEKKPEEASKNMFPSDLMIILQIEPETVFAKLSDILMTTAEHLRASVRIRRIGEEMEIFEWSSVYGTGERLLREAFLSASHHEHHEAVADEIRGVLLYLEIGTSECLSDCFADTESVAAFLGASNSRRSLSQLGLPLLAAEASPRRSTTPPQQTTRSTVLLIIICCLLLVVVGTAVASVQATRKRTKTLVGKVWKPPTEQQSKSLEANRLAAVGFGNFGPTPYKMARPSEYELHGYQPLSNRYLEAALANGGMLDPSVECMQNYTRHAQMIYPMSMLPPEAPSEDCLRQSSASLYPNLAHEFGSDQIIGGEDSPKHATDAVEQSSRLKMPIDKNLVNVADDRGMTPLLRLTALRPDAKRIEDVLADVDTLKDAGADLNAQDHGGKRSKPYVDSDSESFRDHSVIEKTKKSLESGNGKNGNTPLHFSIMRDRTPLLRKLLILGADPIIVNDEDSSPLHWAAKYGNVRQIEILLAYPEVVKYIDTVDSQDRTPLMLYCSFCQSIEGAERLVSAGADILFAGDKLNNHRYRGLTALHHAAISNNALAARWLLEKSANRDAQDTEDKTPLWHAVFKGNEETVAVLLEFGASMEFADHTDRNPVHIANEQRNAKILQQLEQAAQQRRAPMHVPAWSSNQCPMPAGPCHAPASHSLRSTPDTTSKKQIPKRITVAPKRKVPLTPPQSSSSSGYSTTPSPPQGSALPSGANAADQQQNQKGRDGAVAQHMMSQQYHPTGYAHPSQQVHASNGRAAASFMDSPHSDSHPCIPDFSPSFVQSHPPTGLSAYPAHPQIYPNFSPPYECAELSASGAQRPCVMETGTAQHRAANNFQECSGMGTQLAELGAAGSQFLNYVPAEAWNMTQEQPERQSEELYEPFAPLPSNMYRYSSQR